MVEAAVTDIADRSAAAAHTAGRRITDRDSLLAYALTGLARYWLADTWPVPEPDPRHHPARTAGSPPFGDQDVGDQEVGDQDVGDQDVGDRDGFHGNTAEDSCMATDTAAMGKRGRRRPGRDHTVVNIVINLPTLLGPDRPPRRANCRRGPAPPLRAPPQTPEPTSGGPPGTDQTAPATPAAPSPRLRTTASNPTPTSRPADQAYS
jgi:hypothetical protein